MFEITDNAGHRWVSRSLTTALGFAVTHSLTAEIASPAGFLLAIVEDGAVSYLDRGDVAEAA